MRPVLTRNASSWLGRLSIVFGRLDVLQASFAEQMQGAAYALYRGAQKSLGHLAFSGGVYVKAGSRDTIRCLLSISPDTSVSGRPIE